MAKEMTNINQQGDLLEEKLVQVNRVAKVVKAVSYTHLRAHETQ